MLSNAVYHDEKTYIPPENYGFTCIHKGGDLSGFYGEVYKRDNDIVIVFRGTASPANVEHDVEWGGGLRKPPEFTSAINYYDFVMKNFGENYSVSMTGHSLGGSMVQYVNAILATQRNYQIQGVAFAPAGVGKFFSNIDPSSIAVRNYIRQSDIIPAIKNKQLGNENIYLPFKNESYKVEYNNGIGEVVGISGDNDILAQHAMLGYWVDVGNLPTRTIEKPAYRQIRKMNYQSDLDDYYTILPKQRIEEMQAMNYLERVQSFKDEEDIGFDTKIVLQIGDRYYSTEWNDSESA